MPTDIGERIASLEAEFRSFKEQITTDNSYIKGKLDVIVAALSTKVGLEAYERETGRFNTRIHNMEIRSPAIIRDIVLVLSTGVVMGVITYMISRVP